MKKSISLAGKISLFIAVVSLIVVFSSSAYSYFHQDEPFDICVSILMMTSLAIFFTSAISYKELELYNQELVISGQNSRYKK